MTFFVPDFYLNFLKFVFWAFLAFGALSEQLSFGQHPIPDTDTISELGKLSTASLIEASYYYNTTIQFSVGGTAD